MRDLIEAFLVRDGFSVQSFADGDSLMEAYEQERPDLVILDILMPGTDGLEICAALRSMDPALPILIVSAKDSPYDRITGLTLGCDDYMVKPFLPLELAARVRALLRRSKSPEPPSTDHTEYRYGPLLLDPDRHLLTLRGEPLPLTPTEYDFLSYLIRHKGAAVSREELLNAYDNTLVYSDYIVSEVLALLKAYDKDHNLGMLYVSDHGESLGEHGIYLHGLPYSIASDEQTRVPMQLWLNRNMLNERGIDDGCLRKEAAQPGKFSHDNLFHSMLGLLNVGTALYDRSLDFSAVCRHRAGGLDHPPGSDAAPNRGNTD